MPLDIYNYENVKDDPDVIYGAKNEDDAKLIKRINRFFMIDIKKCGGWYSKFDYEFEDGYIELKSRRINSNQYETTLLNIKKLENMDNDKYKNKILYILFNFIDGLYYIKYSKKRFEKFNKKTVIVRHKNEVVINYEIPLNKLKRVRKCHTIEDE